jgi:NAD(P)-dependent dehydrogenase (short-subunit alcohol dehydrogenase family)
MTADKTVEKVAIVTAGGSGMGAAAARRLARDSVPMQRYGRSDEIAATIAFLASEGAGYITGQNLRVDGGLTRSL